jgi:hypothetical protein
VRRRLALFERLPAQGQAAALPELYQALCRKVLDERVVLEAQRRWPVGRRASESQADVGLVLAGRSCMDKVRRPLSCTRIPISAVR